MTKKFVTKIIIESMVDLSGIDIEDARQITDETTLENDLNLDSLDIIELTENIEDKFRIRIPNYDALEMKTFGSLVDYIVKHTKKLRNKDVVLG